MTSRVSKLYTWSVALEFLMFFLVSNRDAIGITANLSRTLQVLVVLMLLFRIGRSGISAREINPLHRLHWNFTVYFTLACVAGLYGWFSGAYAVGTPYRGDVSGIAAVLNSEWFRPLFEYVIALYYFVYFLVLPRFLLRDEREIDYFFRTFFLCFNASLVIGVADYILYPAFDLIGRNLYDSGTVGHRFHGLAGEPREAFVYLILGMALSFLRSYRTGRRPERWWLLIVAAAALLTESASGLVGLVIFAVLLFLVGMARLNKYVLAFAAAFAILLVPALHLIVDMSWRLADYKQALMLVWDALERGDSLPLLLTGQSVNIYPVYHLVTKLRDFDVVPLFIGFGLGSASAINNVFGLWGQLSNPHSQLIRTIYESGLLGLLFFLLAFYRPIAMLTARLPTASKRTFLILTLLVLGSFLGHRTAAPYVFVGMAIVVLRRQPADRRLAVAPAAATGFAAPPLPARAP